MQPLSEEPHSCSTGSHKHGLDDDDDDGDGSRGGEVSSLLMGDSPPRNEKTHPSVRLRPLVPLLLLIMMMMMMMALDADILRMRAIGTTVCPVDVDVVDVAVR